jgi:hypothetical protein
MLHKERDVDYIYFPSSVGTRYIIIANLWIAPHLEIIRIAHFLYVP